MKPFEYRGINPASNEWVYGHYALIHDGQGNDVDCIWIPGSEKGIPIIPETLGVKVGDYYVGDLFEVYNGVFVVELKFNGSEFCLEETTSIKEKRPLWQTKITSSKYIGTIHDHLLVVKKGEYEVKNKYEEALNSLILTARKTEDIWVMQELVDKETPVKPTKDDQCGRCEVMVVVFNGYKLRYCPNCGQRIDWSNEE